MRRSVTALPVRHRLLLRLLLLLTTPLVLTASSGVALAAADPLWTGPVAGPVAGPPVAPGTEPVGTWPLRPEPTVVRRFDPPTSTWGAGHRGVDLLATPGQAVRAALPGTVTYAGTLAGRGVLVVAHGSTRTTYEPVAATVEVGAVVAAGDRVGTVQAAPSHCVPRTCLHWGWIAGETYLDPLRLVGEGPVRLLPLLPPPSLPSGRLSTGSSAPSGPAGTRLLTATPPGAGRPTGGPPVPAWW